MNHRINEDMKKEYNYILNKTGIRKFHSRLFWNTKLIFTDFSKI